MGCEIDARYKFFHDKVNIQSAIHSAMMHYLNLRQGQGDLQ